MSRRPEKIDCRASWRDLISADFREVSFSTATAVYNSHGAHRHLPVSSFTNQVDCFRVLGSEPVFGF